MLLLPCVAGGISRTPEEDTGYDGAVYAEE